MTRLAGLLAAIALILVAATEASAQAGWYVTPSLTLSEEFDDNVFYSSTDPRADLVSRASPGVGLLDGAWWTTRSASLSPWPYAPR